MIIGLTGPAGAGKDTVADYLVERYGFIKLSWARPLKQALEVMGFPEPTDRDDKEKLIEGFNFSWRQAAQALGTEWGRALDPDIWVKIVGARLRAAPDARWIISDVRFDNEASLVVDLGGEVWSLLGRQVDLGAAGSHASEAGVRGSLINTWLKNDRHISELFDLLDWTLASRGVEKVL